MRARNLHSKPYDQFRALLTVLREEAGLTQRQLADALRTTQSFISQSERGSRRVDFVEFIAWARACGKPPQDALKRYEAQVHPDKSTPLTPYPPGPLPYFLLHEGTDAEKLELAKKILELAQSPARPKAIPASAKKKKQSPQGPAKAG